MTSQTQISKEIKSLYDFHEYDISKERILELTSLILDVRKDITPEQMTRFCMNVKSGKYGMMYKAPSCLMGFFREFLKDQIMIRTPEPQPFIDNDWEIKKLKQLGLK